MIDFLKDKKIIIVIGILAVVLVSWRIYSSLNFEGIDSEEIVVSKEENDINKTKDEEEEMIVVHITGEVKKPGVVRLVEGSRMEDVISAAGGLTDNADITNVNLAAIVEDGIKIKIPNDEEIYDSEETDKNIILLGENDENESNIININTASQEDFEKLPGIGSSIAKNIIEYRNKNGKFKNLEDIKKVTGIGDSKFEKIKDLIKIK